MEKEVKREQKNHGIDRKTEKVSYRADILFQRS